MAIEVVNRQRLARIDKPGVAELAQATLTALLALQGLNPLGAQVTIAFVRDAKIRALNRDYRGKNYATDVLSFAWSDEPGGAKDFVDEPYLGDIVISTDTATRQAKEAKLSFEREVQELVIHGILHLCGYNHETDKGEMNRLEKKLRKKLLD